MKFPLEVKRKLSSMPFFLQKLPPEAIPFQDPIDEICAQPEPVFLRSIHYLLIGFFITLLVVAALTKVDVVVVASGRLATATPPIMLQPMERGIIREMKVRPGDVVSKGQVLATLDPTFAQADTDSLNKQLRSLEAQLWRLEAENDGRQIDVSSVPDFEHALQAMLYHQRQDEYSSHLQAFDEDIKRLYASLQGLNDDRNALGREIEVAKTVEQMRTTLQKLQVGSKLNMLEAQANRMRTERNQQDAANKLQEFFHNIEARQAERQAFINNWHRELTEAQVNVRIEISRIIAALAKATRLKDLVVVTAPDDGVVLDIAQRTVGSVLTEAEPLLTIIPRDAQMIADVTIASGDVGDAIPGSDVKLKVDAFPYQRHGMLTGRLLSVSEESFSSNGTAEATHQGAMHRGRIELLRTKLEDFPLGAKLFPGMTLTAEIRSGTRSILSYFLYPLTRGLRESMREP